MGCQVIVINKQPSKLKVRVDSDRYVIEFKVKAEYKGNSLFAKNTFTPTYIINTSDSFVWIESNQKFSFDGSASMSYITVHDENQVPICINRPIPSDAIVTIENNLISFDEKTKNKHAEMSMVVENRSNVGIEARVEKDEGFCTFEQCLKAQGISLEAAISANKYYKAEKTQEFSKIGPGLKAVFFVAAPLNNKVFVTIKADGMKDELCKNNAAVLRKVHGHFFSSKSRICGPIYIVENGSQDVARITKKRFYHTEYTNNNNIDFMF